ncbi:MAG TPA: hypothetical protein VFV19_17875 [Candidatus Polarisedimenticolaceae bacterium]|nr:hypothetical protein [Candidatus Polarisedimenticolaceae bacterium]
MQTVSPCRCINSRALFAILSLVSCLLLGGFALGQDDPKRVETNNPGQIAGQLVLILGQGFSPNEIVELDVVHADGTAEPGMGHTAFTVVAGADGAFVTNWTIRPEDAQGDQFQVSARGGTTGVVTTASFGRTVAIGTDKFAYGPTESALITGTGFLPGEGVTLQVVHDNGGAEPGEGHDPWVVTADVSGTINSTVPMNPGDTAGNEFIVTAKGGDTGLAAGAAIMDSLACPPTPPPDPVVPTPLPSAPCPPNLNSCTANDVVTTVVAADPGNNVCGTRSDTLALTFTVKFQTTASQRYDLGIFVSEDGGTVTNGSGNTPPTALVCGGLAPQVGDGDGNADTSDCDSDHFLDLDPTGHAPNNAAVDTCGDLQQNAGPVFLTVSAVVSCETVDQNLHLKVPSCRVWEQNANHQVACTSLAQAGTGSKCDCTDLDFTTVLNPCVTALCDDGNDCTTDSCTVEGGVAVCHNVPVDDGTSCSDGNACTTGDTCGNGVCHSGTPVVCDDGNACTNDSCDPATGNCVYTNNTNPCSDGNACTTGDVCGNGTCNPGTAVVCNDHNGCTDDSCDPSSGCVYSPNTAPCDDGNACTTGDVCGAGSCHAGAPLNCNDGNPCTDDSCNPASGCVHTNNTAPCDDGNACTTNDTCGGGSCHGGAAPNCNDGNPCTDDSCNPATGCVHTDNTAPCDDGNACTTGDTCAGGSCVGGPAPNCDDGNPCTDDSCNPASGCVHTNNTAPCDDGNACTTGDTCGGGSCHGGPAPNCDDGNPCTDDSCNPASGCVHTNNTAPCNDGNACTTGDTCGGGSCHGGPAPNCDDGNPCTDDSCNPSTGCVHTNNTAPCDDGNACTTGDTCGGGTCNGGPAPNCDDGNPCTDDSCNPSTGCVHTNNTAPCDDGNACTTGDTCGGGTCVGGPAPNCDDGNVCTIDSCNPATGCVHDAGGANGNPCDDGNACTGVNGNEDHCNDGSCQPGGTVPCDDGNVCTTDTCNPASGCVFTNNTAPCNDGNACTTGDTCGGGTCHGGPAPNCDDGNPCTDDSCNPVTGCVHTNNTAPCNDGNACTTGDTCGGGTCHGGAAPNCDDGNPCTDDSCNPSSGCVHTNNTAPCSDGNACTTGDTCGGGTCHGGAPPNCNDGNPCTDDSCNPSSGCVHTNNTAPCNDGNACTTGDACSGGTCVGGPAPNCNDNNVCTTDSCNPATGCTHVNNTAPCDDGNACTTNDTCSGGTCHGGSAPNCNDGNPCTTDSCNPASGCVHTGSDGSDNSCGQVTDTMFCALPTGLCGNSPSTPEFRLLDLQNPTFSSVLNKTVMNDYIINASNPGQFYYNVFYSGTPGSAVNLTIELSYPFVTQGANPIQVHSGVSLSGGCYQPSPSLSGFTITTDGGQSSSGSPIVALSDYGAQQLGSTTAVYVSGTVPASGLVYVTIHVDYGLKKVSGWQQATNGTTAQGPDTNLDNVLDGLGDGPIYINSPQPYTFDFSGGGPTHTYTPSSCNTFKKNSGVNGNTLKASTGNPVTGVRVQFFDPKGVLIATTTTDADGFYNFIYKAKGKAQSYTVKLPDYGKQQTVTLKANGYSRADFVDLP